MHRDTVHIDGQEIELTLPNAARIRAAIKKMRQERNEARRAADFREPFGLADLRHRHDAIVAEARSISYHYRPDGDRQELLDFVSHATPGSDGQVEKTLPRIRRAGGPVIPCNRRHDGERAPNAPGIDKSRRCGHELSAPQPNPSNPGIPDEEPPTL